MKDIRKVPGLASAHLWRVALWIVCATFVLAAAAAEDKVFRTGLSGKRGMLAVAPDGGRLLFTTDSLAHGLRVLALRTGKIDVIQAEAGRFWEMPNWSHDGKQVVAVSTAVRNGYHIVGDMQVILIDPATWQHRTITTGEGVKNLPFFSADGKRVYYFKGVKRESGKTPASRFDLYSVDLATGQERQLTHEKFYQAGSGDDDGDSIAFGAIPTPKAPPQTTLIDWVKRGVFRYRGEQLTEIPIDTRSGFLEVSEPLRDKSGNLYLIAAKNRPGGGHFLWFLIRAGPDGSKPIALTELPISMGFSIARHTGEIWVMDRAGDEIVFRRLDGLAAH